MAGAFDEKAVRGKIRDIPDYPKKGIMFKDITPLLKDPLLFSACMDELAKPVSLLNVDYIAGIEARGFIIGSILAAKLCKGFIPIRKAGKLPYDRIGMDYKLEYGSARIEMHRDAVEKGSKVAIVDDLLATGGTASAAAKLVTMAGAKVTATVFLVELTSLKGRQKLGSVISLIKY